MLTIEPLVISPDGEFDIFSQKRFEEIIEAGADRPFVVLDFSRVGYIDSSCISVLIRVHKRRLMRGRPPMHLAAMGPVLRRIFQIAALDQLWPTFDTVEKARAAFET